jgi:DNA-binding CsgD family transcriptional regulator
MLGIRYQLTTAECRVFTGLVQGRRVTDLAAEHGVKVSTVRSQVSSLRAKFGVGRIEDLVRIAAELPPMAPSFRSAMAGSRGKGR